MEVTKTYMRIRFKSPKKSPPLTDSGDGWKTSHNEGKPSSNGDIDVITNVEYPKSTTDPTCLECGKTFRSDKALFGHLRCHPKRSYKGAHPPPMTTNKRHCLDAYDSAAKPMPSAPKWATRKRSRRLPVRIEDDSEEAAAARILMQISKAEPVVISNGLKTLEGEKIIKKKKMEETELQNVEPGACGRRYKCGVCMKSFSSHQALGGHKTSHRKNKNTNPKEACGNEYQKEATHYPSHSAHSSNQIDHKKPSFRVFDFDLNEIPKREGEEEINLQGV